VNVLAHRPRRNTALWVGTGVVGALLAAIAAVVLPASPAGAAVASDAQAAAQLAASAGYRSGVGVLDLRTGQYVGAGEDTASFAAESVVKVFIAAQLLLTGQMTGSVEATAYQMITQSDDAAADALYGLAGGDQVIDLVAAHYGLPTLGTAPENSGWWGNTEINARALVYFYAAVAKDPSVGPWLIDAMAHFTPNGADGTDQTFGLPSATTAAAVKQGWGDDGNDSPNAVFNSTGYVDNGRYAVAILVDGPPATYGSAISAMVTAEARTLMPGGAIDDPTLHNPTLAVLSVTTSGSTVTVAGTATDPDATAGTLTVQVSEGQHRVGSATVATDGRFDLAFTAANGRHTYTVTVPNVGEGTADATATAAVTVAGSPYGTVSAVTGGPGTITVRGTETDPNLAAGRAPGLIVTVDRGRSVTETVSAPAGDFQVVLPAPAGHHEVTVTYSGTDGAADRVAGTWPVTVGQTAAERRGHALARAAAVLGVAVGTIFLGI
jgi:hypothetical protein